MKLDIETLEEKRGLLNKSIRDHRSGSVLHMNIQDLIKERNLITKRLSVLYYRKGSKKFDFL